VQHVDIEISKLVKVSIYIFTYHRKKKSFDYDFMIL